MTTAIETLSQHVRDTINDTSEIDPRVLAHKIADNTPQHLLRAFYEEALVGYVRTILAQSRNHAIRSIHTDTMHETPHTTSVRKPARSAKRIAAGTVPTDRWHRFLNTSVAVAGGLRKRLGSCTSEDIGYVVEGYNSRVEQNARWANYYAELHVEMTRHNVATVDELPTSVIETIGVPA